MQNAEEVKQMNKSLSSISHDIVNLEEQIRANDGELTEALEKELSEISTSLETKVDAYKWRIDRLDQAIGFWKKQEEEAARTKQTLANHKKQMELRIKQTMVELGRNELTGDRFGFYLSSSKPSLSVDESRIEDKWKIQEVKWVLDKDKIKEALLSGETIEGAELTAGWTLRKQTKKEA
jgi:prefoldin subunit 5